MYHLVLTLTSATMVLSCEKVGRSVGLQAQHLRITEYISWGQSGGLSNRSPCSILYNIYKHNTHHLVQSSNSCRTSRKQHIYIYIHQLTWVSGVLMYTIPVWQRTPARVLHSKWTFPITWHQTSRHLRHEGKYRLVNSQEHTYRKTGGINILDHTITPTSSIWNLFGQRLTMQMGFVCVPSWHSGPCHDPTLSSIQSLQSSLAL